ncbi:MAG: hypothetical protein QXI07_10120, partial [Pyrobaculum sp.]
MWTRDANGNGRPDPDEMILINYGYARSNWNIATISNPSAKLSGNRGIVISVDLVRGPDAPPYVPPVPLTLTLTTIDSATDPWVSVSPTSTTIAPGGTTTFTLTVRPPSNAIPTTYIGELVVTNNVTGFPSSIPYSFNVFTTVGTSWKTLTEGVSRGWPPPNYIRGANNWGWRFESGDWRWFFVRPSAADGLAFEFEGSWTMANTSLILNFRIFPLENNRSGQFSGRGSLVIDIYGKHFIHMALIRRSALSEADSGKALSDGWALNFAVGCTHGCLFCYVQRIAALRVPPEARRSGWGSYLYVEEDLERKI